MVAYVYVASIHAQGGKSNPGRFINFETRVGVIDVKQQSSIDLSANEVCGTMPTDEACIAGNLFVFHCGNTPIYGRYVTINPIRPNLNTADNWVWNLSEVQIYEKLGQDNGECESGK